MAEAQMETETLYLPLDIVQASPGFTCDFGECCFCIQKVKMVKNPSLEEKLSRYGCEFELFYPAISQPDSRNP